MPPTEAARVAGSDPADDRRVLFVGDIQGCARELEALLDHAGFRPGAQRLVPVGDTVNRGPDAAGTLALLRQAGAEPILGNHELSLLEFGDQALPPKEAAKPGSAVRQLREAGQWQAALAWIAEWPHARQGAAWVAVHAGLHPTLPPEQTPPGYLANVRYCTPSGDRPPFSDGQLEQPPLGYRPWWEFYYGARLVAFGHWARRGLVWEGRVRGLDSGCVYGGMLSGWWWPEDRLVQVPSLQAKHRL